MIELLKGYNSQESAHIVHNYPYGFYRTDIKYWIETDKKRGDRFVSCTLNPKTNQWNKPKKSVYNSVMVMTSEKKDNKDFISYIGLYPTTSREEIIKFEESIKGFELNLEQKEQLRILKAYSKTYENVEFKISGTSLSEEEQKAHDEEQKKIKDSINKQVAFHYRQEDF